MSPPVSTTSDEDGSSATSRLCLTSKKMTRNRSDKDKLYCYCRKPYDDRYMIGCEGCDEWYHGECVQITRTIGKTIDQYFCPSCISANPEQQTIYFPKTPSKTPAKRARVSFVARSPSPSRTPKKKLRSQSKNSEEKSDGNLAKNPTMFDAPHNRSNVILIIGEDKKEVHVSKEFLSVHSPYFATLFDSIETGKDIVVMKDIVHEELIDLLHLLYLGTSKITDRTVLHILKLADRFQMERVKMLAVDHLSQSEGLDTMKKLLAADQYKLHPLRDHCLQSFTSAASLTGKIKSCPEYANLSKAMKIALWDRTMELETANSDVARGARV